MADEWEPAALVAAVRRHEESAAQAMVRRLYPLVLKMVRSHRTRRTAEEDLCQMIFLRFSKRSISSRGRCRSNTGFRASRSTPVSTRLRRSAHPAGIAPGLPERRGSGGAARPRRHSGRAGAGSQPGRTRSGRALADSFETGRTSGHRFALPAGTFRGRDSGPDRLGRLPGQSARFPRRQKMRRQLDLIEAKKES